MYELVSSDPFATEYAGWVVAESFNDAKRTGSHLVAVGNDLVVYDLSVPFEPEEAARLPQSGRSLAISDGLAYVAGGGRQLHVIDVADPANPRLLTTYVTDPDASAALVDVAVEEDLIVTATQKGGVLIFQQDEQQGPVGSEDDAEIPVSNRLESAFPNPAAGAVNLRYRLEQSAAIRLHVYDLLGRRIDVRDEGTRAAGRHELSWRGDGISAGTYLIQLEMGDVRQSRFVHVVK